MSAIMSCPVVALPDRRVTTEEILDILAAQRGRDSAPVPEEQWQKWWSMMRRTRVETRYWVQEPDRILIDRSLTRDMRVTARELGRLAERAAREALEVAEVGVDQIGTLIVTSTTGFVMPGVDALLVDRLGLSPRVRRMPVAQLGCAGTGWALARAREQVALHTRPVLLVAAESFSVAMRAENNRADAMVWKTQGGDGAAAAVIRDTRDTRDAERGLLIEDAFEYLLPGSTDSYRMSVDEAGLDFHSKRSAVEGVEQVCVPLREWLAERAGPVEFAAVHTGGPRILTATQKGLGLPEGALDLSWASMRGIGNVASVGLHDVLSGLFADPPMPGAQGVVVAYGPGFTAAAITCRWVG